MTFGINPLQCVCRVINLVVVDAAIRGLDIVGARYGITIGEEN